MKTFALAAMLLVVLTAPISLAQSNGGFKPTEKMSSFRFGQTATLLPNGKVLIAGGRDNVTPVSFPTDCEPYTNLASSELYDPSTGSFTGSGSMSRPRLWHTATLLSDGRVLVVGGDSENRSEFNDCVSLLRLPTAELYDPSTGRFTDIGSPIDIRSEHTATLLRDGKVLFVGPGPRAEFYDPATQTFSSTGTMPTARWGHTATLLADGTVLVTGGWNPDGCVFLDDALLYEPATGGFTPVGNMSTGRYTHSAALLANGNVLITGGTNDTETLLSAELYDPSVRTFGPADQMTRSRSAHSMTPLQNGKVLIAGGDASGKPSAELYEPTDGTFSTTITMNSFRASHNANMLPDGIVLVTGGGNTAEVYDPGHVPQAQPRKPQGPPRDFNGDGKSDLLWRDAAGSVSMWLLNGDQEGEDRFIADIWPGWTIAGAGDFNGDERADVLWRDNFGAVVIWLMDGATISGYREVGTIPPTWTTARVADFNGDGRADILWHDPAGKAAMWLMEGFAISANVTVGDIGPRWNIAGAADFDRDGKADIFWRHVDSGHVAISLMDGPTVSGTRFLGAGPTTSFASKYSDWTVSAIADFDGDEAADILWRDIRGNVFTWLMNDTNVIHKWFVRNVWIDWKIVGTGDYDGDKLTDILWRDSGGNVVIWSMDGIALSRWKSMGNVRDRNAQ